jgi:hypothetical protein
MIKQKRRRSMRLSNVLILAGALVLAVPGAAQDNAAAPDANLTANTAPPAAPAPGTTAPSDAALAPDAAAPVEPAPAQPSRGFPWGVLGILGLLGLLGVRKVKG